MSDETLRKVAHHYWLKHPEQTIFHAYIDRHKGSTSLCDDKHAIGKLNDMEIPGTESIACLECFAKLYNLPRLVYRKPVNHRHPYR